MDNNRYSVLLVDDEEDIIRIIMKKLDWESMGLTIIGHAANGVEALEMAVHPPLVSVPFLRVLLSYPGGDTHSHLSL